MTCVFNTFATADVEGRAVLVAGTTSGAIERWDVRLRAPIGAPMVGHASWIRALAIGSWEGRAVLASAGENTVRLWDLASGSPLGAPIGARTRALAFAALHGRPILVTVGESATDFWDLATAERCAEPSFDWAYTERFVRRDDALWALTHEPHDGEAEVVRVWRFDDGTPMGPRLVGGDLGGASTRAPLAVADLGGRPTLVSGVGSDGALRLWSITDGALDAVLTAHEQELTCVATLDVRDRSLAITGAFDGTLCTWDLGARMLLSGPQGTGAKVNAVAVVAVDGEAVFVSASRSGGLRFWDALLAPSP